jgi:hypothetical protein
MNKPPMNKHVLGLIAVIIGATICLAFAVHIANKLPADGDSNNIPPVETPTTTQPRTGRLFRSVDDVTQVVIPATDIIEEKFILGNPFSFQGTSTAFESTLNWEVSDATGAKVAKGFTMIASPDAGVPGPFEVTGYYDVAPKTQEGVLVVFEASAKDGTPLHVVTIPVHFGYTAVHGCDAIAKLAFGNTKEDPNVLDCTKTYVTERVVCGNPTTNIGIALHELLKGVTKKEKTAGYTTAIPPNVRDPKIDVGTLDFGEDLQAGVAGSCRVGAIRAQILNTALLNTTQTGDDGFTLSINGETETILQP